MNVRLMSLSADCITVLLFALVIAVSVAVITLPLISTPVLCATSPTLIPDASLADKLILRSA